MIDFQGKFLFQNEMRKLRCLGSYYRLDLKELSEDMIEVIWRKMIQGFIEYERKIFDKVHQKKD